MNKGDVLELIDNELYYVTKNKQYNFITEEHLKAITYFAKRIKNAIIDFE